MQQNMGAFMNVLAQGSGKESVPIVNQHQQRGQEGLVDPQALGQATALG